MSFDTLGLHEALTKAVADSGYDTATEVQTQAIPPALEGRDLMVSASTGSGKTASFILPARAGEILRPWLLARREGLDTAALITTIVIERLLDFVTVLVLLAAFFTFFDPGLSAMDPAKRNPRASIATTSSPTWR